MGLDSIELIVSIEDKFGIQFENAEAEKMYTIQNCVDCIFRKINIHPTDKCLKQMVFYRIRKALKVLISKEKQIQPDTKISTLFHSTELKEKWNQFRINLGLELPNLAALDLNPKLDTHIKIFGIKTIKRNQPISKGTMKQLVDWIISLNRDELIDVSKISSKYEIERIVCGITEDRIGVPINEIELHHSFTKDLGID